MARAHVIGAGVAGLAAALGLTARGVQTTVYESAGRAGGRCRSFHDDALGCEIDNGNHLLLSGNGAVMDYLGEAGAGDTLLCAPRAIFPFVDLADGARWRIAPNAGRLPWWIFVPGRRAPGTGAADYAAALRFLRAAPEATVADVVDGARPAFRRFWEPLAVAVLNAEAHEAQARLLWPVLKETFGRGEAACRPCVARDGLSRSFIDPVLKTLASRGAEVRMNARLRALDVSDGAVRTLRFTGEDVALGPDDVVVSAVPAPVAGDLVPGLVVPRTHRAIANAHFVAPDAVRTAGGAPFIGIVNGTAQWLFLRGAVISVTVSAADRLIDMPAEDLAARLWGDVGRALGLPVAEVPAFRIVKEKRATFAQTPAEAARRPGPRTAFANLVLAGDWTDTGLPATIEGAIRSGRRAAAIVSADAAQRRAGP